MYDRAITGKGWPFGILRWTVLLACLVGFAAACADSSAPAPAPVVTSSLTSGDGGTPAPAPDELSVTVPQGQTRESMFLSATDYLQIMPDVEAIVEWYKSTGLRPYLDPIEDDAQRQEFLDEYRSRLDPFYPKSEAGGVPFLFRRIFIVAGV